MNIRPRFSIRTLLILVTLVALYFGCWELTKRWGVVEPRNGHTFQSVAAALGDSSASPFDSSPAPFVVSREIYRSQARREYHLWLFGLTAKLPFERDVETDFPPLIQYLDIPDYDVERDGVVKPIDF